MTCLRRAQIHTTNQIGTVYLLHFSSRYHHAQHYIGWTTRDLDTRLGEHWRGNGSALTAAVHAIPGISMTLARTWTNVDRCIEKVLKCRGESPQLCPICNPTNAAKLAATYGETTCYTNQS